MKTHLSSHRRQNGFTYMSVVITMIVLGIMLAAYLKMVAVQNQLTMRSQTWNRSVPVLEAGIEEALAHLNKNGSPDSGGNYAGNLSVDGWTLDADGGWHKIGEVGGDYYYTRISPYVLGASCPIISSTGYVRQATALSMLNPSRPFFLAAIGANELVALGYSKRAVACNTTNIPTFSKGLIAKHGIDMNGNNVLTDSYDSKNPLYSTSGRWVAAKRRDHGDIASNDTLTNIVNVGNANVWGSVATGPHGTVGLGPNGAVGDAAWQNGGNHGIQPGHSTDDMNVQFPDVVMPTGSGGWLPPASASGGYQYVFNLPGDYLISGTVSGKILVAAAGVRLRVDGGWNFTGQDGLTIGTNASIKIYLNCPSASITGQGILNMTGTPSQCYIFGTSRLTSLDIGGNGEATCAVYAPYADVKLHGGGNSVQDFSGAIVANTFTFTGHYNIHYDEALGRTGLFRGFTLISWDER